VSIVLLDPAGGVCAGWQFTGATPVAYQLSPLDALGNEIVIETLELGVRHFATINAAGTVDAKPPSARPKRSRRYS
jgi:hypothetical protein